MPQHAVDWPRLAEMLDLACEMRDMNLRQVAQESGVSASGLTRLRQGYHLSADALAALVAWLYPKRIPTWITEEPSTVDTAPAESRPSSVLVLRTGRQA